MEKRSRNKIIMAILLLVIAGIGIFIGIKINDKKYVSESDAVKFKNEYENLNGKDVPGNDKTYRVLNISKDNPIVYADFDEIMSVLDGTGVIYFGFPECPWCRSSIPVILEAAEEIGIDKIYYINNLSSRDTRHLDDNGAVVIDKEGTTEYYQLLEKIGDFASVYTGLNDSNIKRIYFPTLIFVKDGKIIDLHVATVDSHEDPYLNMTYEQKEELKNIYLDGMNKTMTCEIGGC